MKGRVAELEMDPKLKEAGWEKYAEFKIWFDRRLDAAIKKVRHHCLWWYCMDPASQLLFNLRTWISVFLALHPLEFDFKT